MGIDNSLTMADVMATDEGRASLAELAKSWLKRCMRHSRRGRHAGGDDSIGTTPVLSAEDASLAAEVLKEDEVHFERLVGLLHDLLLCDVTSAEAKDQLHGQVVHLLSSVPRPFYAELLTEANPGEECSFEGYNVDSVAALVAYLERRLDEPMPPPRVTFQGRSARLTRGLTSGETQNEDHLIEATRLTISPAWCPRSLLSVQRAGAHRPRMRPHTGSGANARFGKRTAPPGIYIGPCAATSYSTDAFGPLSPSVCRADGEPKGKEVPLEQLGEVTAPLAESPLTSSMSSLRPTQTKQRHFQPTPLPSSPGLYTRGASGTNRQHSRESQPPRSR
ncbi:hypothetical protein HPB51_020380 [Rhipicephalus microplus]|uniref:Uncharacterized protein n=1 Tax=Rhipicephalus microplus TaxID=6941 RepID=A0A9J6DWE5_RHIMP|nr:hypothetical protein HPB51_020380 [Rhipicephalus microplus]